MRDKAFRRLAGNPVRCLKEPGPGVTRPCRANLSGPFRAGSISNSVAKFQRLLGLGARPSLVRHASARVRDRGARGHRPIAPRP